MEMVSLSLPAADKEALEAMVEAGHFPSRSAAIRVAIKMLIVVSSGLVPDAERAMLDGQASERETAASDCYRRNCIEYRREREP